jgi:hypothetical protein
MCHNHYYNIDQIYNKKTNYQNWSVIYLCLVLDHFDIVDFKELGDLQSKKDCFYVYLDEKNHLLRDYNSNEFESKGFYERTLIQDFPIRGKAVYLGIRR